jgi:hypothetical protein
MSEIAAKCLVSSWDSFSQEENIPGLAELVVGVVRHTDEEWRVNLSLPCYISCLFNRLLELWREGAQEGGELF